MGLVPPRLVIRRDSTVDERLVYEIDKAYPGYTMRETAEAFTQFFHALSLPASDEEELQPIPTYPTWEPFTDVGNMLDKAQTKRQKGKMT